MMRFQTKSAVRFGIILAGFAVLMASAPAAAKPSGEQAIRELYARWAAAFDAKDTAAIMKFYSPGENLVVFDVIPPLQYQGADAYKKDWDGFFGGFKSVKVDITQLAITSGGTLAFAHSIQHVPGTDDKGKPVDLTLRVTDCLRKEGGKWLILHEHISTPVNLDTGKAELNLKL